jgi:hypothetical protein
MKNNIVLLLPYFGKLPNYFNLWLKSASCNEKIDFVIIGDNQIDENFKNIKSVDMSFEEVQKRIKNLFGKKAKINSPYKLCEYKPANAHLFPELVDGYDYWGFCDPDVIWGDIYSFIKKGVENYVDRLYFLGHLSIFKNSEKINNLYLKSSKDISSDTIDFETAISTNKVVQFSEMGGITRIFSSGKNVNVYAAYDFADVDFRRYDFFSVGINDKNRERYRWENGKAYRMFEGGEEQEVVYVHLQKRKMNFAESFNLNNSTVFIKPNIFSNEEDVDFWKTDDKLGRDFEKNVKKQARKKKRKQLVSFDYWKYRMTLVLKGKKSIMKDNKKIIDRILTS